MDLTQEIEEMYLITKSENIDEYATMFAKGYNEIILTKMRKEFYSVIGVEEDATSDEVEARIVASLVKDNDKVMTKFYLIMEKYKEISKKAIININVKYNDFIDPNIFEIVTSIDEGKTILSEAPGSIN